MQRRLDDVDVPSRVEGDALGVGHVGGDRRDGTGGRDAEDTGDPEPAADVDHAVRSHHHVDAVVLAGRSLARAPAPRPSIVNSSPDEERTTRSRPRVATATSRGRKPPPAGPFQPAGKGASGRLTRQPDARVQVEPEQQGPTVVLVRNCSRPGTWASSGSRIRVIDDEQPPALVERQRAAAHQAPEPRGIEGQTVVGSQALDRPPFSFAQEQLAQVGATTRLPSVAVHASGEGDLDAWLSRQVDGQRAGQIDAVELPAASPRGRGPAREASRRRPRAAEGRASPIATTTPAPSAAPDCARSPKGPGRRPGGRRSRRQLGPSPAWLRSLLGLEQLQVFAPGGATKGKDTWPASARCSSRCTRG